jgi:putative transposase
VPGTEAARTRFTDVAIVHVDAARFKSMGRAPRIEFEDALHHVTGRGNNLRLIFHDARDREFFLALFGRIARLLGWRCPAYCLMGNHYHVVVETPTPNLAAGMCRLNGAYARYFNIQHSRRDHLFGARYRAKLIEDDTHFLETCRYVVLNPVRAGLCETAEEWRWSSFRATAGLAPVPAFLDVDWVLRQFHSDRSIARDLYIEFIAAGCDAASLDGLLAA